MVAEKAQELAYEDFKEKAQMAYKIEDLQTKAEMAHSLQEALYTVIYHQDIFPKDTFDWAFVLLGSVTADVAEGLEELTRYAFESFRNTEK